MLIESAQKTVKKLTDLQLLTEKDALTVALIEELCNAWPKCENASQQASIARELRQLIQNLPQPEAQPSGSAQLLGDIANA